MKLSQYIDPDVLLFMVLGGRVEARTHKTLPLTIYTYSRQTVIDDEWNEVTMKCRGLIVDGDGNVLARPFEKFFNINTTSRPETQMDNLPKTPPLCAEKLDGSLGILYVYDGQHAIASKGSFHSEHAEWATRWYREQFSERRPVWPEGYTPIFEMICESVQHHVVHYGRERLVLTALVNVETGEEAEYRTLCHVARKNHLEVVDAYNMTVLDVVKENRKNAEGYVLSWALIGQPPLKVKVKHAEFLRLQRILNYTRPKDILEFLIHGCDPECQNCGGKGTIQSPSMDWPYDTNDTIACHCTEAWDEWLKHSTPQFAAYVQMWVTRFKHEYEEINARCRLAVKSALLGCTERKEFAEWFFREIPGYAAVCFAMLDEKDYQRAIWKLVKPLTKNAEPFAINEEE